MNEKNYFNEINPAYKGWEKVKQEDKNKTGRIPSFMGSFELEGKTLDLDKDVLGGGYFRGVPAVNGGFPGQGKTTWSIQQAVLQAERGYKVLYITYEQSEEEVIEKMLGILSERSYRKWEEIKYIEDNEKFKTEHEKGKKLLEAYLGDDMKILHTSMKIQEFPKFIKEIAKNELFDIVYVDNIQNLNYNQKIDKTTQFDGLTNITRQILSKYKTTVLIWLSQLTSPSGPKNVKTANTKWCNKIVEDASTYIIIHRGKENKDENAPEDVPKTYFNVNKNRKGSVGMEFENGSFVYDTVKERIGSFSYQMNKDIEERMRQRIAEEKEREDEKNGITPFDKIEEIGLSKKEKEEKGMNDNDTSELFNDDLYEGL